MEAYKQRLLAGDYCPSKGAPKAADGDVKAEALDYHEFPKPGKFDIIATKAMNNAKDLALAYSPGVAEPCLAIKDDPSLAYKYTNK